MKSFDFSKFKKIAEDDKTVTMAHENGHSMRIIKSAIPKIQREQLKMLPLAKGGEVEGISTQGKDVRNAKKAKARGREADSVMDMEFAKEEAKGRADHERMIKPKMKGLAEGGGPEDAPDAEDQSEPQQAPVTVNVNGAAAPVSQSPPVQAAPAQVTPVQPVINSGGGFENQAHGTLQSQQAGQAGIQGQAEINAAKDKAALPAEQEKLQAEQQLARQNAAAYQDINKHAQDFANYFKNNPINPNHYQESQNTGAKVGTAIGLLLGGFSTPFGGRNFAFDHLQNQINRDIDAQKSNAQNQQTIWGAYQHLYNDNNVATALAKASSNDILAHKIQIAALQQGTPQSQVNAQMAIQKLGAESDQLRQGAAAIVGGKMGPLSQNKSQAPGANGGASGEHILNPNANELQKTVALNPLYKPYAGQIAEQKTKAAMSDEAIDAINEVFPKLQQNVGGVGGYLRRKAHLLSGVPIIGHAAEGIGEFVTDVPENQAYDSDVSRVIGAVRGALQGNVSDELLNETIRKNTPEIQDTPDNAKKKLYNLKQFIKEHTRKDLLQMSGLSQ